MTLTPANQDESERLALLQSTHLLESEGSPAFDALIRLLAQTLGVPAAAIHLIDGQHVWALACTGLGLRQVARTQAPCTQLLHTRTPLRVRDLREKG